MACLFLNYVEGYIIIPSLGKFFLLILKEWKCKIEIISVEPMKQHFGYLIYFESITSITR